MNAWNEFQPGNWQKEIDVRDFIQKNYRPYDGSHEFLEPASEKTKKLWAKCQELLNEEFKKGGVLDIDAQNPINITSHSPGYIDKDWEIIFGLQTDQPLKRAINVYGGLNNAIQACEARGYHPDPQMVQFFRTHRRTHNDGVFAAYTPEMRLARKNGIITGLPDAYGRGRIIGDYRRVALYGVDFLIRNKKHDLKKQEKEMNPETIRLREELHDQIEALEQLKEMACSYGFDISRPANDSQEAVQWLYFGYLAAIKQQNGAAMSLGRTANFIDIYLERDLKRGYIDEHKAQEIIDQLIIKLRLVRHLRSPEYQELFAGDPNWVTEALGGVGEDGRHLVTKSSFRFLHSLNNLGPAPEPNLTVLWSKDLPGSFLNFCAQLSIRTSSLQYENDDLMRPYYGDDYAISCCVSAMKVGKETQFFGARCNLAKLLLYAINGGRDEFSGDQVGLAMPVYAKEYIDYDEIMERFQEQIDWLAGLYVNTMNIIHYMHDHYAYESLEFALHDTKLHYYMAFGIAGLSVAADSLSAIKYARVKPVYNEQGLVVDFQTIGNFPKFGNDRSEVDQIAIDLIQRFTLALKRHPAYKQAEHTLSILTITSNVMYGKHTGTTPDGRKKGEPFAPGANPFHGREERGALAAFNSIAKLPYEYARDGISYTFSSIPTALGSTLLEQTETLTALMQGYFTQGAHHINVNVMNIETLKAAQAEPEKYPDLTIRVSGYAVHFTKLNREQQEEIIRRTFYHRL